MSLINIYGKISSATGRCEFSIGVFVDLSKAFDTLDHGILFKNLNIMVFVESLCSGSKVIWTIGSNVLS